jgi:1-acyl-sn-glycerol-3-phosphate acyltransferase
VDLGTPKLAFDFKTLVALYRGGICLGGLLLNGMICYAFYIISNGKMAQFNYDYISPFFCRIILRLIGVKVIFPKRSEYPKEQMIYTFNHNSYLDIFIIPAMRIPNCRYIISDGTKSVRPLYLSNLANGAIFIPLQRFKKARVEFFKKMVLDLKQYKYSLFCSAEGTHDFKHWISKFNRGIFHMAMEAKLPICPIFFNMAKENNPFQSFHFKNGTIKLEILPVIETKEWTLEQLDQEIANVRNVFVQKFNVTHGEVIK